MGFLSDLFGGARKKDIEALLNPISAMTLREFVIADDDPDYLKHYFRYTNRESKDEEFVTIYQRFGGQTIYARTHWKRTGIDPEFRTLSERGPWSMAISHLIREGERLAARTRPTRGHFISRVPAGVLISKPQLPVATPAAPTTKPTGEPGRSSVQASDWQARRVTSEGEPLQRFELTRSYQFAGLSGADTHATLRVVLTLEGEIVPEGFSLGRKLRFYLFPFRLPHEADFTLTLMTIDSAAKATCSVLAAPVDGDSDTAVIARYEGRDDVAKLVTTFMAGRLLQFSLADAKQSLINFQLPNDASFKRLYDGTCQSLASGAEAGSPPVDLEAVRGKSKEYAIWLVELDGGEYRVMLVKLNAAGNNMEDGWALGPAFKSREEQGSYGLSVARDLRISLCDVVKNESAR